MPRRNVKSDVDKKREGSRLREIWERHLEAHPNDTQHAFCERIGFNQGMLQQIFSGNSAMPLEYLLDASIDLGFDPRAVSPDIDRVLIKFLRALAGNEHSSLVHQINQLPKEKQDAALEYVQFLGRKTD